MCNNQDGGQSIDNKGGKIWLQAAADAVRVLACEMITAARSGHPGLPLGMADIIAVLWNYCLRHNPRNPNWLNRDRFVLSNGHGSAMLYAALHLSGYDLSMADLQRFRQMHSKTPGHPEYGVTSGVEVTTGPLGQGVANAVGLALAERALAAQFNRPNFPIIDHFTYLFAGDGCLMEGVAYEAISLAGTQKLEKLVMFWDNNGISIDGEVHGWFDEDVAERFRAMHWRVMVVDGHDPCAIRQAIDQARNHRTGQPTLIACQTIIGKGSRHAGHCCVHGSPLKADELAELKREIGWQQLEAWEVPEEVYQFWNAEAMGARQEGAWQAMLAEYSRQYPALAAELVRRISGRLPETWAANAQFMREELSKQDVAGGKATRQLSQLALECCQGGLPELLGGSADLTSSNLTWTSHAREMNSKTPGGNYLRYGVREFGMCAIMNGLALHGGFLPFAGTFLVFAEYAIAAIRMAAIMRQRVIYVLTHDSIGSGEDGPTHQPIEQLAMLRAMPNLTVWRPASGLEVAVAWQSAIEEMGGPVAIALSRQALPSLSAQVAVCQDAALIAKGGYLLWRSNKSADVRMGGSDNVASKDEIALIATGSEVAPALQAAERLANQYQLRVRVVSMPSVERFLRQEAAYRECVLPAVLTRRVVIEAASSCGWHRFAPPPHGLIISIDEFGASAPAEQLFAHFGFTAEKIVDSILKWLKML